MAVLYDSVVPVVAEYADAAADGLAIPQDTSVAQETAKADPASASVFKAFNTIFGHVLEKRRPLDVFIVGDNAQAKAAVETFIESLGLRPLDIGALKMAHWLEAAAQVQIGLGRHGARHRDIAPGLTEFLTP